MRKLTIAQVATMTASMTASIGMIAATTSRLGIPMLGLAALAHADPYGDDELEEVVVTGYVGTPWIVETYRPGTSGIPPSGGSSGPPTAPPVARSPTNAPTTLQRNAVRCAQRFSIDVNVNDPHGQGGQAPGYSTQFVSRYGWGANGPGIEPAVIETTTNAPPDANHQQRILGWTSTVQHVSYIYTLNIQYDVQNTGVNYEAHLINTLVHEWAHGWWPYYLDHSIPDALGDAAQALYEQSGGANAECNTRPPRYGNLGGRK
jgi:hypothetical protein